MNRILTIFTNFYYYYILLKRKTQEISKILKMLVKVDAGDIRISINIKTRFEKYLNIEAVTAEEKLR